MTALSKSATEAGRTSYGLSRMKPWRAALTSATASGKSTRIVSRSAIACSSGEPGDRYLRERGGGELDRGVQRQRRELLALGLLHRLGLLLGELAQTAEQILGIAAERDAEAATFHAVTLAERQQVAPFDLGDERLDCPGSRRERVREGRGVFPERPLEPPSSRRPTPSR